VGGRPEAAPAATIAASTAMGRARRRMDLVSARGEPSQSFGEVKSDRERSLTLGATYQPPVSLVGRSRVEHVGRTWRREIWGAMLAKLS